MRRLPVLVLCTLVSVAIGGCAREKPVEELTFETSPDTTGLSEGADVLQAFEPYRMSNGAMRVRGRMRLPDGTRASIAVRTAEGEPTVTMAHVTVEGGAFDSPPLIGERGPLPKRTYRFEVTVHFTPDWQTAEVLRATGDGRALRGPGITRGRDGRAALFLIREATL